ncbi:MAG: hypothetical protein BMS9Abin30_0355 [Gammaproteobacteria bacterium]|nr:MAG: hypothetical protein BMS9Abin30_0355 [Gammaproteobacteria bacterium]
MGQVTIYIDAETEKKMMASAKAAKVSKSRWITSVIREKVANEWPVAVTGLAGAWADFPSIEDIRSDSGKDAKRENF